MKTTALILVTITPFFTTFSSENVSFRDGTSLAVGIFNKEGFEPDKNGVILTVKNKIYLHHYPCTDRSLSVPDYYYDGPNPYGISSCCPTRVSFFHFETFTLSNMRSSISRMNIPAKKKAEAIKGIDRAMSLTPPKAMTDHVNVKSTKMWQRSCEGRVARRFEIGQVVWGKDLKPLKKYNALYGGKTLTVKRR